MSQFEGMEDILKEFLVESYENLDRLDQEFVILEEDPGNRETLASIFRTIHTIKGTSGFFGMGRLEKLAHAGENLLSLLRDGKRPLTPEVTTALLSLVDAVRRLLRNIEDTQAEGDADHGDLIAELARLTEAADAPVPAAPAVVAAPPAPEPEPQEAPAPEELKPIPSMGQLLVSEGLVHEEQVEQALQQQVDGDPRHLGEILVEKGSLQPGAVKKALNKQAEEGQAREGGIADSTLRVEVANLDRLMNLAGELVLVRNQLLQFATRIDDATFNPILQRLNIITTELQEGVMKTRMQPIGNLWNKFPRIVRDLAMACNKQVRLEMEGRDTELDKTLLEAIKDPLTHIVRNSVDHGVEDPATRLAAGKPEEGVIHLRAFHEGGQVNIEIRDDGAGIDAEAIRRKAVERRLVTAEAAEEMSDRELINLIFLPGFSTARQVTNVSGRGVGMDVVKTNIRRIGGIVDMQSEPGRGSVLKIKIPLTLAIIPALVVKVQGERFAVPQVSLLELVRLEGEQARQGIEMIHGAPVYRLRGRLLPLVNLRDQLGYPAADDTGKVNIVVLQADGRPFGLIVDEITDTEEIVVKPLWSQLKQIRIFAGATIMGDGSVALILDVLGLAQQSRVIEENRQDRLTEYANTQDESQGDRETLLLFRVGDNHMAVPLDQVDRLEELPWDRVERTGDQEVVQYRGRILPLVRPESHLPERRSERRGAAGQPAQLQVVVYSHEGASYGLVVDGIEDIAHEAVAVRREATREGVLGVIVVNDRITEMLDLQRLARLVG
ncbi:MAG: chemotaxis protein CheW [Candidatus Delongbacteria bacterium]